MDFTLIQLQHYWWFLVSLLGALLVFLMFVQGGQSLIFTLGKNEEERRKLVNSTGRKWEFTFTTLVTFGGAFFASFPLFYSTSFGGAYWVWMLILSSFILQAVSYEYQSKRGNLLGKKSYRIFLVLNGVLGPILIGTAVGTFFNGANFIVNKDALTIAEMPIISYWANSWHGLEAVANVWNVMLGLAIFFLARVLGTLYFMNNLSDDDVLFTRCRSHLLADVLPFLFCFIGFVVHLLYADGYAVDDKGVISLVPYKYLHNLLDMPLVTAIFAAGVVLVLGGIIVTLLKSNNTRGIWYAGVGTVLTVLGLLLLAGYNNTAYYPSLADMQSSLTIYNSSSTLFTLKVMSVVSLLIPFVLGYIVYAWYAIDKGGSGNADDHHY